MTSMACLSRLTGSSTGVVGSIDCSGLFAVQDRWRWTTKCREEACKDNAESIPFEIEKFFGIKGA